MYDVAVNCGNRIQPLQQTHATAGARSLGFGHVWVCSIRALRLQQQGHASAGDDGFLVFWIVWLGAADVYLV
jgi:hypothetical protein